MIKNFNVKDVSISKHMRLKSNKSASLTCGEITHDIYFHRFQDGKIKAENDHGKGTKVS